MRNWIDITTRVMLILAGIGVWVLSRDLVPHAPGFVTKAIFDWMIPFTCGAFVGVQLGELMKEVL